MTTTQQQPVGDSKDDARVRLSFEVVESLLHEDLSLSDDDDESSSSEYEGTEDDDNARADDDDDDSNGYSVSSVSGSEEEEVKDVEDPEEEKAMMDQPSHHPATNKVTQGPMGVVQQLHKMMEGQNENNNNPLTQLITRMNSTLSQPHNNGGDDIEQNNDDATTLRVDDFNGADDMSFGSDCPSLVNGGLSSSTGRKNGLATSSLQQQCRSLHQHPLKTLLGQQQEPAGSAHGRMNTNDTGHQDLKLLQRVLYVLLVLLGVCGSLAAIFLVQDHCRYDHDAYEKMFQGQASEVAESIETTLVSSISLLRTLSKSVVAATNSSADQSPFPIPHFAEQANDVLSSGGVVSLSYLPIMTADEWSSFRQARPPDPSQVLRVRKPGASEENEDSYYYLPLKQTVPEGQHVIPGDVWRNNEDGLFEHVVTHAWQTRRVTLSPLQQRFVEYDVFNTWTTYLVLPLVKQVELDGSNVVVGFLSAVVKWQTALQHALFMQGYHVEVHDGCGGVSSTFALDPSDTVNTSLHAAPLSKKYRFTMDLVINARHSGVPHDPVGGVTFGEQIRSPPYGNCQYSLQIYTTSDLNGNNDCSWNPTFLAWTVAGSFATILTLLFFYDLFASRRQRKLMDATSRTHAIVSGMFPKSVQERILSTDVVNHKTSAGARGSNEGRCEVPIAELFLETTVMFADIVGFTAWSSMREPTHVFQLLESVYHEFDKIATQQKIFKVETIGDCYVAVCGLPDPRRDHAVAMAHFAEQCLKTMECVTKELEVHLGPDTAELCVRVGMHSGPVTGGVLRGERARFQLFGDTMNMAARMESTGRPRQIHLSQETANLLKAAGRASWVRVRTDIVHVKGKGDLRTFWLTYRGPSATHTAGLVSRTVTTETEPSLDLEQELSRRNPSNIGKFKRLVEWNTEVLVRVLKQVMANRSLRSSAPKTSRCSEIDLFFSERQPFDEVAEVIEIPNQVFSDEGRKVELDPNVSYQVQQYVADIAAMYRDNSFHNFEHASHVGMSVVKLISRIVKPTAMQMGKGDTGRASALHSFTYGITSDPLTQFACIFAALVHDTDHTGASNAQLLKEDHPLAKQYHNKSIAEQNSIELAWNHLMSTEFCDFRRALMPTHGEQRRFRQLVVNAVMATDIMDKDLKKARNERWDRAFCDDSDLDHSTNLNRKATIVIEHLIQASDVAHTMQHWHVYRKWNERLFMEMATAFSVGRADKHPAEFWYEGEIGFFDFYIIPLAKKLKECGVFGVSSDEYLNYALKNRQEWVSRGKEVVSEMMEQLQTHPASIGK